MSPDETLTREVMKHGFQIEVVKGQLERRDADIMDIRKDLDKLEEAFRRIESEFGKWVAAAQATEKHAKRMAEQTITARQFYVALGIFLVGLTGLLLGIHS